MSLRLTAESDLEHILENTDDFGWPITLVDPASSEASHVGFSNDISDLIDPNTGQAVSGRRASVALRISSLPVLPVGIANAAQKPWLVKFNDPQLTEYTFKVIESNPDRGLGIITLILEVYIGA